MKELSGSQADRDAFKKVKYPIESACGGCPPGDYCYGCMCRSCKQKYKCAGMHECIYDDEGKLIKGVE